MQHTTMRQCHATVRMHLGKGTPTLSYSFTIRTTTSKCLLNTSESCPFPSCASCLPCYTFKYLRILSFPKSTVNQSISTNKPHLSHPPGSPPPNHDEPPPPHPPRPLSPTLASLQSPAFKLQSTSSYPPTTLDSLYLTSYNYHPGPFYYLAASSSSTPPLIGYLNGTDNDLYTNELALEFINVVGAEGDPYGMYITQGEGNTTYTPMTLILELETKGVYIDNRELQYLGPS